LAAARAGQQAVISSMDLNGARRAITDCQRCLSRVSHTLKFDIYSFESDLNLTRLESEFRGEWRGWLGAVKKEADAFQRPLHEAEQALFDCLQEISERVNVILAPASPAGEDASDALEDSRLLYESSTDWYKNADSKAQ